jgi:hypothetical protein
MWQGTIKNVSRREASEIVLDVKLTEIDDGFHVSRSLMDNCLDLDDI